MVTRNLFDKGPPGLSPYLVYVMPAVGRRFISRIQSPPPMTEYLADSVSSLVSAVLATRPREDALARVLAVVVPYL